ncbi:PhpK family radical SAM P-methyltransferase [Paenibacillus sp. FSL H8-0048]|uniref:PhpK family radical SAM P-methyltransferase n=1 Tax=Paenibacillus sp. FSL H8-0048 TaxID=2954508 RepID=UPI0030F7439D
MIDCLLIGHNEFSFSEYEKMVGAMGKALPAYRDLNYNFWEYKNQYYTASDVFNKFVYGNPHLNNEMGSFSIGNYFNAAVAYLGTFLDRRGHSFDYVVAYQDEKEQLAQKLLAGNIRVIAILTTLYVSVQPVLEIISFIKKYNADVKIVLGGPFIASQMKTTMDGDSLQYFLKSVDADFYVNSSQGEAALEKIINNMKNGLGYDDIDNLFYRNGSRYIRTQINPEDNKLDENMVKWQLFGDRIGTFASLRTSISCPFSCNFCAFPKQAGKYQTVGIECVERELDALQALGKVKSINFIDDTLNVPPARFKEMLKMMIKNKYDFKWNSHYRCQFADRETVALMKESGCEGVFLGIESGSQQILKNMNKSATIEKYKEGIQLLKEYGIITYASFIIGYPGETRETVQETFDFIDRYKPDFFRTQLWYCDPTTPIWAKREQYGIEGSQFKWSHDTMDAQTACNIIEEYFMTHQSSVWVPQYNFEFSAIFNLLHRGMDIDQVKTFMVLFNKGIKEKLEHPEYPEVSEDLAAEMEFMMYKNEGYVPRDNAMNVLEQEVEFDF